jgi:hypothetical protein
VLGVAPAGLVVVPAPAARAGLNDGTAQFWFAAAFAALAAVSGVVESVALFPLAPVFDGREFAAGVVPGALPAAVGGRG